MVIIQNSENCIIINKKNLKFISIDGKDIFSNELKDKSRHLKIFFVDGTVYTFKIEKYKPWKSNIKILKKIHQLLKSEVDIIEI